MEWNKKIQSEHEYFDFTLEHEKVKAADDAEYAHDFDYGVFVSALDGSGYHSLTFKGYSKPAKSVHIAAVANKYDIISELGEDKRKIKRGFLTKKEATDWEMSFRLIEATNLDMTFKEFKKECDSIENKSEFSKDIKLRKIVH